MNSEIFLLFIKDFLIPSMKEDETLILDNASFHVRARLETIFSEAGLGLDWLPPYSPELNPIENIWSKVKSFLKKKGCFGENNLFEVLQRAIEEVTCLDIQNTMKSIGFHV